ncbi:phage portal protein family protein [Mycolicibacterium wolinskyi]|uniref:phage portal protein family protein n=1 Tax=Mycolicibacterium wolinskyi TaxID=59750 RepID=UPI003917675E
MAKTRQKKNPIELGDSGVQIFNGIISSDEYRPELRGRYAIKMYEEMRRGDATVHAGLMAVKYPIISVTWNTESGGEDTVDEDAKELIDYNFTEVLNWRETLTEMLTMLDFGFYVAELVFDVRPVNGVDRIVLVKIAYRKQTTIEAWETKEHTPGITQRLTSGETVSIPMDKLIILSHQKEGDNWEGLSILRSAYQNWYYKKTFYQIDAVKHERQALGVVKIKYPKGADQKMRDEAKAAAANVRANERAYIEEPEGWDINFMDMQANTTADPKESIAHHDRQILKNMAVQYIDIGAQSSSGSFAASTDQRALLEQQDQAIAEQIAAAVNEVIVKKIVDLNFTVNDYPKWKPGRVAHEDVAVLAEAATKFKSAGMLTVTDEDEEHARSILHFPDMNEDIKGQVRQTKTEETTKAPAEDTETDESKTDDKTKAEDVKVEASLIDTARQLRAAITEKLYTETAHESPNAA